MDCVPTSRLVCTEPGRATRYTFAAPPGGGSATVGFGVPAFFHAASLVSTSLRASASVMSPANAISA